MSEEKYVLLSCPTRRFGTSPPQFLALDGERKLWIPDAKKATHLTYAQAIRIRRRFAGGNILMKHA